MPYDKQETEQMPRELQRRWTGRMKLIRRNFSTPGISQKEQSVVNKQS